MNRKIRTVLGAAGTLVCITIFVREPSFPTPDKLLVFAVCVGLLFGQAWELFKRLAPFALLLFVYESFRGLADHLNTHVNYTFMIDADKLIGWGHLPTAVLQHALWHGSVQWYDFILYIAYMLHFVIPILLAIVVWKKRESYYWQVVSTYVLVSFAGFLTFALFPAAPPWMAHDAGLIEPISRVSSSVWSALGIHDFPSLYNQVSPNPVAAMPSLHAAYATLFVLFIFRLFKGRWRYATLIYPFCIYFGTVYMGEHYVIDALAGVVYAVGGFVYAPKLLHVMKRSRHLTFAHTQLKVAWDQAGSVIIRKSKQGRKYEN